MKPFSLSIAVIACLLLSGCDLVSQALDGTRCATLRQTDFKLCLPKRYFSPERSVFDEQEVQGITFDVPRSEIGFAGGNKDAGVHILLMATPERFEEIRDNITEHQLGLSRSGHTEKGMAVLLPNPKTDPRVSFDALLPEDGTPAMFTCLHAATNPSCTAWRLWYDDGRHMNVRLNYSLPREDIGNWNDDEHKLREWISQHLVNTAQKSN